MKLVIEDEDTLQKVLRSITGDTSLVKVTEQELHKLFDQKLPAVYFSVDEFKSSRLENLLALCIEFGPLPPEKLEELEQARSQWIKARPNQTHFGVRLWWFDR